MAMSDLKPCPFCGGDGDDMRGMHGERRGWTWASIGKGCWQTTEEDAALVPAFGTGPLDTPFRKCVNCTILRGEKVNAEYEVAKLRIELEALKERLAGLVVYSVGINGWESGLEVEVAKDYERPDGWIRAADLDAVITAATPESEPSDPDTR